MRMLIDWLAAEWTPQLEQQWSAERFAFTPRVDCANRDLRELGDFGFDLMLLTRAFTHRDFEQLAHPLLRAVADGAKRRKSNLVKILADAAPGDSLRMRLQMNDLPAVLQYACENAEMKKGWKQLGAIVDAAAALREQFGEVESPYAGHWLAARLGGGPWDGSSSSLLEQVGAAWDAASDEVGEWQALDKMIKDHLLDLEGTSVDTLNIFFRDWGEFVGSRFGWYHDANNKSFWGWVAKSRPDLLRSGARKGVLKALGSALSEDEAAEGELARINWLVSHIVGPSAENPSVRLTNFEEFSVLARRTFGWR